MPITTLAIEEKNVCLILAFPFITALFPVMKLFMGLFLVYEIIFRNKEDEEHTKEADGFGFAEAMFESCPAVIIQTCVW